MTVTIFVWKPHGKQVGHASMGLSNGTYISWWPTTEEILDSPAASYGMRNDKHAEGDKIPDYASAPIEGLDEDKISSWWTEMSGRKPGDYTASRHEKLKAMGKFQLFSGRNCSNMVARALIIGGIEKRYPRAASLIANNFLMTPLIMVDVSEYITGNSGNKVGSIICDSHNVTSTICSTIKTGYQYIGVLK